MLSLFKRKAEPQAEAAPALSAPAAGPELVREPADDARRNRQQNIKVSDDCALLFAALAKAQGLSKAALFEDLVAARFEELRRQGVQVEISGPQA
jgi:azurin